MVPVEDDPVAKVKKAGLVVVPDAVNKEVVLLLADRGVPVSEAVVDRAAAGKGELAVKMVPDAAKVVDAVDKVVPDVARVVDKVVPAEVSVDQAVKGEAQVVRLQVRIQNAC